MKIRQLTSMLLALFLSLGAHTALAECTQPDKNHIDKNVSRCPYSQKDLNRAHKKLPERYNEKSCFYCGCTKESHTIS